MSCVLCTAVNMLNSSFISFRSDGNTLNYLCIQGSNLVGLKAAMYLRPRAKGLHFDGSITAPNFAIAPSILRVVIW